MKMVDKKPVGKLTDASAVLRAVKTVLAQEDLQATINSNIAKVKELWSQIDSIIKEKGGLSWVPGVGRGIEYRSASWGISNSLNKEINLERINYLKDAFDHVFSFISPGVTGGVSADAWYLIGDFKKQLTETLDVVAGVVKKQYDTQRQQIKGETPAASAASAPSVKQNFVGKLNSMNRNLDYYKSILSNRVAPSAIKQAVGIIDNYKTQVSALLTYLKDAGAEEAATKEGSINELEKWITDFANSWKLSSNQ
jgi:hypothetical protein